MLGTEAEEVQQSLNEVKTMLGTTEFLVGVTLYEVVLAALKLREGDTSSAEHIFRDCLNFCRGKNTDVVSLCLERLADRGCWCVAEPTSTWSGVYLTYAKQSKDKLALIFLGDVFIWQGDDNTAHSLFTAALQGFNYIDGHRSRVQCLLRLGDLAHKKGDISHAMGLWRTARPLFERSSQAKGVAQIDARFAELERNQKVLVQLAVLNAPQMIFTSSGEVEKAGPKKVGPEKGADAGQNLPEGIMVSAM
ncbi:hypothetical protein B0H13DRAFT_1867696 [Mycena leptocephala]|nr:hypothetical protein B0H13DRAFT_1867696 [Mycena leptocephala]